MAALWPHQSALGLFGIASACKVSFKSFIYVIVPRRVFFAITGYVRAANLVAHVLGGTIGFSLRKHRISWVTFYTIQQACLCAALFAFGIAVYALQKGPRQHASPTRPFAPRIRSRAELYDLVHGIFPSRLVNIWSVWIIVAHAVYGLVLVNTSTLFFNIDRNAHVGNAHTS